MVNYTLIYDRNVWNEEIIKNENCNPYQMFDWGLYKSKFGWKVASIKANEEGKTSYFQITYKVRLNIFFGFCVGSISGDIGAFRKSEFLEYIKAKLSVKYVFIKGSFINKLNFNESLSLYSSGWKRSEAKLNSGYTIFVDLKKSEDNILTSCSSNFKRNIKRGKAKNHKIKIQKLSEFDIKDVGMLFDRFGRIKDAPLPSGRELDGIKANLSSNIIIASSMIDDEVVGLRAFFHHGDKALDFWAATDLVGRKNYTSFVLLFELLVKAKQMGIETYDMSGIDPLNNPTVYGFKNGLRADNVEQLGTWDLSNSKIISFFVNRVYL